ncbi:phage tail protein [Roseococcus microcysteis]|uniref:phage tail protein n=1 Tax=Roseococcus microcysteis TaxID=2771361 RepID=UPI00168B52A7|nr:phage tail protein [Roseococcus microcysteis]
MVPVMLALLVCVLWSVPVGAEPITASIIVSLKAAGIAAGTAAVIASAAVYLVGALASFALSAIMRPGAPRAPELIRDLARPQSLPPYRYVYGRARVSGSPAPMLVRGRLLCLCIILNSRPSNAFEELYLDKRAVGWSGDPYDFTTGGGALITSEPFSSGILGLIGAENRFWIGLGNQTSPPADLLAAFPELAATDGWQGRTVLWAQLNAGPNERRAEIWPRTPPEVEVVIQGCRVWDPADIAQDPDNEATWTWTPNRALCLLDALRTNPVRPYPLAQIHLPSFLAARASDAATVAKLGGTESRYRADGVLIWTDRELEDQVAPLVDAGGSRLVRIGGKLGLTEGVWIAPTVTIDEVLDEGLSFQRWKPGRDLATTVAATYLAPARDWQMAAVPPYRVPGAQAADGGPEVVRDLALPMVTSPTQAQRLAKITAFRNRAQRRLEFVVPPRFLNLVAGVNVTVSLPAPYAAMNGTYEVVSAAPRLIPEQDDAVAASMSVELLETSAAVFAWDPATEEQAVDEGEPVVATPSAIAAPTGLTLVPGETFATGETILPAIRVQVNAPTDARAQWLDAEWRVGSGGWVALPSLEYDWQGAPATTSVFIVPAEPGVTYEVRARWAALGQASAWVSGSVVAGAPSVSLSAPIDGTVGGATSNSIDVSFRLPNQPEVRGIRFYFATVGATSSATLLAGPIFAGANQVVGITATGLAPSTQYYFWARTVGPFDALSNYSDSVTTTTAADGGGE